ncbi:MAG: type III-A CRISPR-associated RAMP protein Csm3, partial [Candidatus Methanofastidiosa archaeon]|nr:type III-A CRISPR-associated RAMP protein Csm3 [Candidatus Methanofastidiosa archaeon]
VPAGSEFFLEMIYDVYDNDYEDDIKLIIKSLHLLCDDYLGGQGSRGYGKINFRDIRIEKRSIEGYYDTSDKERKIEVINFPEAVFPEL